MPQFLRAREFFYKASPVHRRRALAGAVVVLVGLAALVNSFALSGASGAQFPRHQRHHQRSTGAAGATAGPTSTADPAVTTTDPAVTTTDPPVTTTDPPVTTTDPPVTTTDPPVTTTDPPVTTTDPATTTTDPATTTTDPATTTTDPATTTTDPATTTTTTTTIASSPAVEPGISVGYTFESTFSAMTSSEQQASVANMKAAGVQWIRVDIYPGDYTYATEFAQYGFKVDAILEDCGATPSAIGDFATQAAQTLIPDGVTTFEVCNEVNGPYSAATYVPLLQSAYTAIKTVSTNTTVLTSGLAPGTGSDAPATYLESMYEDGAKGYFDAANVHPYSFPDLPEQQPCASWNTFCTGIPAMRQVMVNNGDSAKQIWITEEGCPTGTAGGYPADCTDATEAETITEAFTQAQAWGYIGPLFIYDWQDSTGSDGDFGLYYSNGTSKPTSLAAYTAAATAA